jgi:hypothetical protein
MTSTLVPVGRGTSAGPDSRVFRALGPQLDAHSEGGRRT